MITNATISSAWTALLIRTIISIAWHNSSKHVFSDVFLFAKCVTLLSLLDFSHSLGSTPALDLPLTTVTQGDFIRVRMRMILRLVQECIHWVQWRRQRRNSF